LVASIVRGPRLPAEVRRQFESPKKSNMDFWQTEKKVNYFRACVDVVLLLLAGLGLFLLSTQLVEPFSTVAKAMKEVSLLEWKAWGLAFSIALPIGLFWMFFYVVFEAVKDDLLTTLYCSEPRATRVKPPSLRLKRAQLLHHRRNSRMSARRPVLASVGLPPRSRNPSSLQKHSERPAGTP
jgi:hypothetical protein